MIQVVLAALLTAGFAHVGAKRADLLGELRASGHLTHGERTNIGAIAIQLDATRHHLDIILVQTGHGAMFARLHALVAGFDTIFVFFVGHDVFLFLFCSVTAAFSAPSLRDADEGKSSNRPDSCHRAR